MASFRNALFLFVVFVGGVNSATFQRRDYKHRSSVWSAKKTSPLDMFSLWKNHENGGNTAGVNGVKGCCWPDLMTTTRYDKRTEETGQKSQTSFNKTVIYRDKANKRVAFYTTEDGVTTADIFICSEYDVTHYQFWKATKVCRKEQFPFCPLDLDFMCFPPNGTLVGSFHLGAGPGALAGAQLWTYSNSYPRSSDVTEVVLTPDNCVPVAIAEEIRFPAERIRITRDSVFTDVTLSISSPSVFTPPPYCNQEEGEDDDDDDETLPFDRPEFDVNAFSNRFAPLR